MASDSPTPSELDTVAPSLGELDTVAPSLGELDTVGGVQPAPMSAGLLSTGASVGRYVILHKLGAGGMGVVYGAFDPELDRKVALKVLLPMHASDGTEGRSRLLREAQLMARLSHPNVVAVHDVGTHAGQLYIAMELIDGATLRDWLASATRTRAEIIATFVDAGRGLAAAHEQGLVHRDFKPDNVMLDRKGRVRVMDFGLATLPAIAGRAAPDPSTMLVTHASQTAASAKLTQAGSLLGTPAYMAPEQYAGDPTDARTDQFAFCVALHEALYRRRPFVAENVAALATAVLECHVPDKPPTAGVPMRIYRIIRRGLSRNPDDRWASMQALLDALARDNSRRGVVALGGAAVLVGAVGWLLRAGVEGESPCTGASAQLESVWDDTRRSAIATRFAEIPFEYARSAWERTEARLDTYADAWVAMHTETCEATAIRKEQSTAVMDLRMACLSRARLALGATTDVLGAADADVASKVHQLVAALPPLPACADTEALLADVASPSAEDADAVARIRKALADANALVIAGRVTEARHSVEAAAGELDAVGYEPVRTEVARRRGEVLDAAGEYAEAQAALEQAVRSAMRWGQWTEAREAAMRLVWVVGIRQGRFGEAHQMLNVADGLVQRADDRRLDVLLARTRAAMLDHEGKYDDAEAELRRASEVSDLLVPADLLLNASLHESLGSVLAKRGVYGDAEVELRLTLQLLEEGLVPGHPNIARVHGDLGSLLYFAGQPERGAEELGIAVDGLARALGPRHPRVASMRGNLANLLSVLKRFDEAESAYREAIAALAERDGPADPALAGIRSNFALLLVNRGRLEEAEALHRVAIDDATATLGDAHPDVATLRTSLGAGLMHQRRYDEAEAEHRRALEIRRASLKADHPDIAASLVNLGDSAEHAGQRDEAEQHYRAALELATAEQAQLEVFTLARDGLERVRRR